MVLLTVAAAVVVARALSVRGVLSAAAEAEAALVVMATPETPEVPVLAGETDLPGTRAHQVTEELLEVRAILAIPAVLEIPEAPEISAIPAVQEAPEILLFLRL